MPRQIDTPYANHLLERLHAAVNTHDADAIAEICSEDIVWDDPAAPEPLRGREAVRRFHRDVMFKAIPDVRIELIDGPYFSTDHSRVAVRLRIRGTMTGPLDPPGFAPTGGPIEFETAEFSQFEGGLLLRHSVVLNMLSLARQIGAVPQPGTIGERVGLWMQHLSARWARSNRD